MSTSGLPGDWLLAFNPFQPPVNLVQGTLNYSLRVQPAPYGQETWVLAWLPDLVLRHPSGALQLIFVEPDLIVLPAGRAFEWNVDDTFRARITGAQFGAYVFAIASNGAWELDVSIARKGGGPEVGPAFLDRGEGSQMFESSLPGLPSPDVAGAVALQVGLAEPAWNHVQVVYDPIQPIGTRVNVLRFPGGHTVVGGGYGYGVYSEALGGGFSSRSGKLDYWGVLSDQPGNLTAAVAYGEANWDTRFFLAHMPGAGDLLPEALADTTYRGFDDPFPTDPIV